MSRRLEFGLLVLALLPGACGEPQEQTPVYTVYGTITSTTVDASRKTAALKLVSEDGNLLNTAAYGTLCLIQGPSCDYSLLFVPEGSYNAFGMIDMNGNMDDSAMIPDSGDLVTGARPLMLWEKTRLDLADSAWHIMP